MLFQVMERARAFQGGLGNLWIISDESVPLAYKQVTAYIVWGNYVLTLFCNHTKENLLTPFILIIINWLLLGLLTIAQK